LGKENYFVGLLPVAELSVDVLLSGERSEESLLPSPLPGEEELGADLRA
jgi:hypothetical protein